MQDVNRSQLVLRQALRVPEIVNLSFRGNIVATLGIACFGESVVDFLLGQ